MAEIRWHYYGPIVVIRDDGVEGEGWGRVGEPAGRPDVWSAMVRDLPKPFAEDPELGRRNLSIRIPGGGEAESVDQIPMVAVSRPGRSFTLLSLGGYAPLDTPWQPFVVAASHRLRWWLRAR